MTTHSTYITVIEGYLALTSMIVSLLQVAFIRLSDDMIMDSSVGNF